MTSVRKKFLHFRERAAARLEAAIEWWRERNAIIRTVVFPVIAAFAYGAGKQFDLRWGTIILVCFVVFLQSLLNLIETNSAKATITELSRHTALLHLTDAAVRDKAQALSKAFAEGDGDPIETMRKARGKLHYDNSQERLLKAFSSALKQALYQQFPDKALYIRTMIAEPNVTNRTFSATATWVSEGTDTMKAELRNTDFSDNTAFIVNLYKDRKRYRIVSDTESPPSNIVFTGDRRYVLGYKFEDPSGLGILGLLIVEIYRPNVFSANYKSPDRIFLQRLLSCLENRLILEWHYKNILNIFDKFTDLQEKNK